MTDRSGIDRTQDPEESANRDDEAAEIPKRAAIGAGMFFPVFIVLGVALVVILYFVLM